MNERPSDPFSELSSDYLHHSDSVRGVIRHELVCRQLALHLQGAPGRVIDVGGGAGRQAIPLAREGFEVVLVDPSEAMLIAAKMALAMEAVDVQDRVQLLHADCDQALDMFGEQAFDVVLCHGVLMYLENSVEAINTLVRMARVDGVISILTKNGGAVAMRAGLEGRYEDALEAMRSDCDLGRLGIATRADTLQDIADALWTAKCRLVEWYGIRVFTDHLADSPPGADIGPALEAEWHAARQDPYRQLGRLLHVIARRETALPTAV